MLEGPCMLDTPLACLIDHYDPSWEMDIVLVVQEMIAYSADKNMLGCGHSTVLTSALLGYDVLTGQARVDLSDNPSICRGR